MVLAGLGDFRTEEEFSRVLASYDFGTPASNILRLSQLGYHVQYGAISWETLVTVVKDGYCPIAFVDAEFLPWADFAGYHAVVVVQIDEHDVALLDPAMAVAPRFIPIDGFLAAWEEFDRRTAIIRKGF
jgi:hypothetical protein